MGPTLLLPGSHWLFGQDLAQVKIVDGNQTSQKHWRDWTRGWTLDIPKAMKGVCEDSLRRQNLRTGLCRQFMETVYEDKVQAECHEQAV